MATRHTITLEVELDVDVPESMAWSQELKDDVEGWVDRVLLAAADGADVPAAGGTLRVQSHSVVVTPGTWPMR